MESYRAARHTFLCGGNSQDIDLIRVLQFEGVETISQPFRFEIDLISSDPDILFEDVINQPASLTMYRGDDGTEINGIVADFEQTFMSDGLDEYRYGYRAVLVPRLWRLSLSTQSRIFQNLTVEEIVHIILRDADVTHKFSLSGSYEPRDYTTQYKETDLAFVQRLLEYEGIRYHVEHQGGKDTVILSDDPSDAPEIEGKPSLLFNYGEGIRSADEVEVLRALSARQRLVTETVKVKDYNYRTPGTELSSKTETNSGIEETLKEGVFADSMIHAGTASRTEQLAKVRAEEIETTRVVMTGSSDCTRFRTGYLFEAERHFRESLNQTYLLTSVHHIGSQPTQDARGIEDDLPDYDNTFTCVPASAPYRPPRLTPEPKLPGVLTAKVESAGGTYAPVDDQGRYRIRFPFDLGTENDAQATKPVRLAQPYTGPGYGQHFPVHKDAEMVVACVDGNVDRILGLSTVYHPTQQSPVTSENAAHNVLRSWGQNELTFDDTQGEELVFMHATKDHLCEVVDNQVNTVGTDRTQTVGHDETLSVGNDQVEDVGHDNRLTVGNNQTLSVGIDRTISVGSNHTESIGSSMSLSVGVASSETVGAAKTVKVGALYKTTVGGAFTISVGAASSESVKGAKSLSAGGPISVSAGADYETSVTTNMSWEIGKEGKMVVGKKLFVQAGDDLSIKGGKKMHIEAANQITIKCGKAQIIMKKNGDISFKGNKMDLKASGKMTLKGSQIAEN